MNTNLSKIAKVVIIQFWLSCVFHKKSLQTDVRLNLVYGFNENLSTVKLKFVKFLCFKRFPQRIAISQVMLIPLFLWHLSL